MTDNNKTHMKYQIAAEASGWLHDRVIRALADFLQRDYEEVYELLRTRFHAGSVSVGISGNMFLKFSGPPGSISVRFPGTTMDGAEICFITELIRAEFLHAEGQWHLVKISVLGMS